MYSVKKIDNEYLLVSANGAETFSITNINDLLTAGKLSPYYIMVLETARIMINSKIEGVITTPKNLIA